MLSALYRFVLISIISFLVILIPPIKNKKYSKQILDDISSNTGLENISYVNKSNNYYIVKIDKLVIVFDLNYEQVFTKDNVRDSDLPLIYKRNNLYYVEKKRKKDRLTYNYYSVDEDKLIFSSVVGGQ